MMCEALENQQDTEQRIFEAAKRVFVRKGMNGTSMQDIATAADISRTSLHYYFRSKRKLFHAVLDDLLRKLLPQLEVILFDNCSFREKIERFVSVYLDIFAENSYLPNFIMNELNKNPDVIIARFRKEWLMSPRFLGQIRKDLSELGDPMDVSQFMMNLISLCVFPFIAHPMIEALLLDGQKCSFKSFIDDRKPIIVDTVLASVGCAVKKRRMQF